MQHKALFEKLNDIVTHRRDIDELDSLVSPDFRRHGSKVYDREEYKDMIKRMWEAFPDLVLKESVYLESGDYFVHRWEREGHHLGYFHGTPPTKKKVTASGITITKVEHGKIAEEWGAWNELHVLFDVGVVPTIY